LSDGLASKAGTYALVCGVPGHEAAGMWDVLKVTPKGTASLSFGGSATTRTKLHTYTRYRLARNGVMVISMYGWGGPSLGTLFVTRTKRGDLVGSIQLLHGHKYPISFHKDSNQT